MSKIVKPDKSDPIEVSPSRENMLGIAIRFVGILAVIIVILTLAWSR